MDYYVKYTDDDNRSPVPSKLTSYSINNRQIWDRNTKYRSRVHHHQIDLTSRTYNYISTELS